MFIGDVLFLVNETEAVNVDHKLIAGIFQALKAGDSVQVSVKRFKPPSTRTKASNRITNLFNDEKEEMNSRFTVSDPTNAETLYRPYRGGANLHRRSNIPSGEFTNSTPPYKPHRHSNLVDFHSDSTAQFDSHFGTTLRRVPDTNSKANDHIYASLFNDNSTSSLDLKPGMPQTPKVYHTQSSNASSHSNEAILNSPGDKNISNTSVGAISRNQTLLDPRSQHPKCALRGSEEQLNKTATYQ